MDILTPGTSKFQVWNSYLRGDYATWQPGQDCELHFHQDAAEIFVFLAGACEFTVENETQVVKAGSTVYVGPGQAHRLVAIGDRPLEMFLAVMPNHEPTHTFFNPDGTTYTRNRPPPTPRE